MFELIILAFKNLDPLIILRSILDSQFVTAYLDVEDLLFFFILYVPSTIFRLNRDGSSRVQPVLS